MAACMKANPPTSDARGDDRTVGIEMTVVAADAGEPTGTTAHGEARAPAGERRTAAPAEGGGGDDDTKEPVFKSWRGGNSCAECGELIALGEAIAPRVLRFEPLPPPPQVKHTTATPHAPPAPTATDVQGGGGRKKPLQVQWLHAAPCAQRHPPCPKEARPVCMHWKRGECAFAEACWFRHPHKERAVGGPHKRLMGGRRNYVRNDGRANTFRKFLLEKFGAARLASRAGVLDVAGGKGELAFQLLNLNGIPATVVDPRPLQLKQFAARYREGMYHRNRVLSAHNTKPIPADPAARATDPPKHLRIFLDDPMLRCLHEDAPPTGRIANTAAGSSGNRHSLFQEESPGHAADSGVVGDGGEHKRSAACGATPSRRVGPGPEFHAHFERSLSMALATVWTRKGLEAHEGDGDEAGGGGKTVDEGGAETDADADTTAYPYVSEPDAAAGLLREASCVVGLHPDQAAGAIVDHALALGVPFAVVPCCVYSKEFPKRKDPEGRQVQSYEQLLAYLRAKHSGIQEEQLGFGGKNTVLWWAGDAHDKT